MSRELLGDAGRHGSVPEAEASFEVDGLTEIIDIEPRLSFQSRPTHRISIEFHSSTVFFTSFNVFLGLGPDLHELSFRGIRLDVDSPRFHWIQSIAAKLLHHVHDLISSRFINLIYQYLIFIIFNSFSLFACLALARVSFKT